MRRRVQILQAGTANDLTNKINDFLHVLEEVHGQDLMDIEMQYQSGSAGLGVLICYKFAGELQPSDLAEGGEISR